MVPRRCTCRLGHGLVAAQSWGKLILHEGSGAACQGSQVQEVGRQGLGNWGEGLGGAGRGDKGRAPRGAVHSCEGSVVPVCIANFCWGLAPLYFGFGWDLDAQVS